MTISTYARWYFKLYGGGGGIRTPARLAAPLGFQDRPLQPDLGTPPCLCTDINEYNIMKTKSQPFYDEKGGQTRPAFFIE